MSVPLSQERLDIEFSSENRALAHILSRVRINAETRVHQVAGAFHYKPYAGLAFSSMLPTSTNCHEQSESPIVSVRTLY
jgi:hypothetical protein